MLGNIKQLLAPPAERRHQHRVEKSKNAQDVKGEADNIPADIFASGVIPGRKRKKQKNNGGDGQKCERMRQRIGIEHRREEFLPRPEARLREAAKMRKVRSEESLVLAFHFILFILS